MNNRLYKICSYITDGLGVIDVGTDHGYLPIELCDRGYTGNIIAADINEDPLNKAVRAAAEAGYSDRISFLLCDGLEKCPHDAIDKIVIAGMGGDTICGILERTQWCRNSNYTLYLQPMSKAEILRKWLIDNGFAIIAEDLVVDNETIYQVISAKFRASMVLNEAQLYIGLKELHSDLDLYEELRQQLIKRFNRAVDGMSGAEKRDMSFRIEEYKTILAQLERI